MTKKIPYLSFDGMHDQIENSLIDAATKIIKSKWYILGEAVSKFENEYATYTKSDFAIGVNSGLDGLVIALKCLGIGKDDEVIIASNAYIACWNAIEMVGASIVPVEPSAHSYNIDINKIESAISPKTKAIMAVHLYGRMCEMSPLMAIAKKYNLKVIEDNAQSQGAVQHGLHSSAIGHISSTSFYPGKNLGALGDAGIITTNDLSLADKARKLRNYGSSKKYINDYIGFNSRLDEIQAALLSVKLNHLDSWNEERRNIASWYNECLGRDWSTISSDNVCHVYCIQHPHRDELQHYLNEQGIQTLIHYPIPPHLQDAYKHLGYKEGDFPIAEALSASTLSLPIYPGLKKNQVQYICNKISNFTLAPLQ